MNNKDTIIEALTMELRLEREGNLALAKRNCDNCESLRLAALDRIKELEDKLLQCEWVGLTHDEVDSWELPDCPTVFEFAQFVEAKLKEKNDG